MPSKAFATHTQMDTPEKLFYLFLKQKRQTSCHDLSHGFHSSCSGDVGQIAVGLFGRAQAIADEKRLVNEKAEIIRLQLHPAGGLPVEQSRQLDGSCTAASQVAHQEIVGHAGMNKTFHDQYMLIANIGVVAEEDLQSLVRGALLLLTVARLDELAGHRNIESANQIGHEHKSVLQQCKRVD